MKVTVQLNGVLSSQCDWDEREFSLDERATVNQLKQMIEQAAPGINFASSRACTAVNQSMAEDQAVLKDGDHVAFFPPLAGG